MQKSWVPVVSNGALKPLPNCAGPLREIGVFSLNLNLWVPFIRTIKKNGCKCLFARLSHVDKGFNPVML